MTDCQWKTGCESCATGRGTRAAQRVGGWAVGGEETGHGSQEAGGRGWMKGLHEGYLVWRRGGGWLGRW